MARNNRDDFTLATKHALCLRVGTHCSNPECRKPTTGPTTVKTKVNNIGQAAHIAAAASGPGAARYDPAMTSAERKSIDNGIWLCQNCATKIDRDPERYPVTLLKEWKRQAEEAADAEHGQPPVSKAEFELMKAAVFKTPLSRTVSTAVAEITRLAKEELERADPRFAVQVNKFGNTTQIIFSAKEPVQFRAKVAPDAQTEFRTKMRALAEHGLPVEMDASTIRLEGSALLDIIPQGTGTIKIDTQLRKKAVQKMLLHDPATNAVFVMDDFVGEIVAGTQSLTFEGHAFDGLYGLRYRFEHASGPVQQDQSVDFTFSYNSWRGRTVRGLPYFDKLYRYFDALHKGWTVSWALEVEGVELLTGSSPRLTTPEFIKEEHLMLTYIKCARELLVLWNFDVPFNDTPISSAHIDDVYALWSLLCKAPKQPSAELGRVHCRIVPQNEEEATALRNSVLAGQPLATAFSREFPEAFNLVGSFIAVNPVRLNYSQVYLRKGVRTNDIKAGKSLRLEIVPTKDCIFSIEQQEPACVSVVGPGKKVDHTGEIETTAR
ncbi:hypothetical protein FSO04_27565 [Paraburkholderia madseniana]|uniref:HNH endonuclease n=1 Tax=Paraburkholderia madseniana TaxID=2599607 RepID=A0A6N6W7V8_9BURK|nr:hypothetical protein [Paraburkholderia madseniana]KAE8756735.1 hypothetical protein FSO04_27565 [Paraburkholderia madseniana]